MLTNCAGVMFCGMFATAKPSNFVDDVKAREEKAFSFSSEICKQIDGVSTRFFLRGLYF